MKISGLSKKQIAICNKLWNLNTLDEIQIYLSDKSKEEQQEIETMMKLIYAYHIDECCSTYTDCEEARSIIEKIMEKSK
jgi:hypothetical protein